MKLAGIMGAAALVLAGCSAQATEQPEFDPAVKAKAQALMKAGLSDDVGLKFVEDLTTEIGPRLAGSDAEARAREWALAELKELGFKNVRAEDFTIPYWQRVHERASVVGDNSRHRKWRIPWSSLSTTP